MASQNRQTDKKRTQVASHTSTKTHSTRNKARTTRSKKSNSQHAELYATTGYTRPQGIIRQIKKQTYEMIMLWRDGSRPFATQRLEFKAGNSLASGWREANKIRDLLIGAGGFRRRDMKLIAVSMAGALVAYQDEYRIKVTADRQELRRTIRKVLSRGDK
jgi:hypothetical protein